MKEEELKNKLEAKLEEWVKDIKKEHTNIACTKGDLEDAIKRIEAGTKGIEDAIKRIEDAIKYPYSHLRKGGPL